jgi:hypothetical protein
MEYELPHAFEPITKYFDHRYFRAPRDVLSFLRDTDPDAGLVLATLENDMVGFEAYIRAGASVDAQIVSTLRPIANYLNDNVINRSPAIRDDHDRKRLLRLFYLRERCSKEIYHTYSHRSSSRSRADAVLQDVLAFLTEDGSLRNSDVLQFTVALDDEDAYVFERVLRNGVEKFELDRALMQAVALKKAECVRTLLRHGADPHASHAGELRACPPRPQKFDFQKTPLTMTCFNPFEDVETDKTILQIARLLLEAGADARRDDSSALYRAMQTHSFDTRFSRIDDAVSTATVSLVQNQHVHVSNYVRIEGVVSPLHLLHPPFDIVKHSVRHVFRY